VHCVLSCHYAVVNSGCGRETNLGVRLGRFVLYVFLVGMNVYSSLSSICFVVLLPFQCISFNNINNTLFLYSAISYGKCS
jgi:hypothetical protein